MSSRGLEEVEPPVGRAQVEHVGPLAVVCRSHSQRVVDGHSVLQVLVGQLLLWPELPLQAKREYDVLESKSCFCTKVAKL